VIVQTWNVNGRGIQAAVELGDTLRADVLLLQEAKLDGALGWKVTGRNVHDNGWGSGIFVREGSLTAIDVADYDGWVAGAKWTRSVGGREESTYLFSIHSPTGRDGHPRKSYVAESRAIVKSISSSAEVAAGARVIIGGDFNFKSLGERLASEALPTGSDELAALTEFRSAEYCVAWKDLNPGHPLAQTLRWTGNQATPFHCDGFLLKGFDVNEAHCSVLSSARVHSSSDHSPVVVWIPNAGSALRPS
jgi:exonuclease III